MGGIGKAAVAIVVLILLALMGCSMPDEFNVESERAEIEQVIRNSIGWALNKDKDLLYQSVAQDADFFIFHPDAGSTIIGFDAFKRMVERVFMNESFKATGFEIRQLKISISNSGDAAWFSSILDDYGEWDGKSTSWVNARWTGAVKKHNGVWVIAQMHFSFATDAGEETDKKEEAAPENK